MVPEPCMAAALVSLECIFVLLKCSAPLTVMWPPTCAWHQRNSGQTTSVMQMLLNSVQDQDVFIRKPMLKAIHQDVV